MDINISPKKIYKWQQVQGKMFNTIHYQGNANQSHEMPLHTQEDGYYPKKGK